MSIDDTVSLKTLVSERCLLHAIMEPFDLVGKLSISDMTIPEMEERAKSLLSGSLLRKLELAPWIPDELCHRYLDNFKNCSPNPHMLRIVSRNHVLPAAMFDIFIHQDLNVLEFIATNL